MTLCAGADRPAQAARQGVANVYKVGFGKRNKPDVSTVRTNTAQEAMSWPRR